MSQETKRKSKVMLNSLNSNDSLRADINCPFLNNELHPDCGFKFKIATSVTGTALDPDTGNVIPGKITKQLQLCCNTVVFNNLDCDDNFNSLLLGIPLIFIDKCYKYTIDLSSVDIENSNNISVIDLTTNSQLITSIEIANGYLYIFIDVADKIIFDHVSCKSKLLMSFNKFEFNLIQKITNCCDKIKCNPLTWSFGRHMTEHTTTQPPGILFSCEYASIVFTRDNGQTFEVIKITKNSSSFIADNTAPGPPFTSSCQFSGGGIYQNTGGILTRDLILVPVADPIPLFYLSTFGPDQFIIATFDNSIAIVFVVIFDGTNFNTECTNPSAGLTCFRVQNCMP